jgi:hypothetical protein
LSLNVSSISIPKAKADLPLIFSEVKSIFLSPNIPPVEEVLLFPPPPIPLALSPLY